MDNCLHKIYNELQNGRKYLMENDKYDITQEVLHNESMFPDSVKKESKYFSNRIKKRIVNEGTYLLTSSCKMLGKEFIIKIVLCKAIEYVDVEKMFFAIYLWLYVVNVISTDNNNSCSKKMTISLFLVDVPKELPMIGSDIISPEHVNSGYTYTCKENNEIVIYREEEWFKVLIHESFHAYGLDFSAYNMDKYQERLTSMFNVNIEILPYEAYCEAWARSINLIINNFLDNPKQKFSSLKRKCIHDFQKEAFHSMIQSCKVLKYMGLSYNILISKDPELQKCSRTLFKENTNVFCYYVLTALLMFYLDDLMNWCYKNNHDCLCIPKNVKNIERFLDFIENRYDDEDFTDLMDDCIDESIDTSLRMTTLFMDMTK